jgi:hypothetical protein
MPAGGEAFTRDELKEVMRRGYDDLIDLAISEPFKSICRELHNLPDYERYDFVKSVLLSPEEIRRRGVQVPEGVLIQRSAFGDRRPTLFCIKKYLPTRFHSAWENVNLTFDAVFADDDEAGTPRSAGEIPWCLIFRASYLLRAAHWKLLMTRQSCGQVSWGRSQQLREHRQLDLHAFSSRCARCYVAGMGR